MLKLLNCIKTVRNSALTVYRKQLTSVYITTFSCQRFSTCETTMSKKALVFLAGGAEEMEFVIAADVLRRGGIDVTIVGIPDKNPVKCSRGIVIVPDVALSEVASLGPFDAMVLPGGLGGSKALAESKVVGDLLKCQDKEGRVIAAVCAAPIALKAHSIGLGKNVTSYPSVEGQVTEGGNYTYKQDNVVVDGNLITSRGPGTAFDFALAIVDKLVGKTKASEVAKAMLLTY